MLMSKFNKVKKILERTREPPYRFEQITDAIFKQRVKSFDEMKCLPLKVRSNLKKELGGLLSLKPKKIQKALQVEKVLFELKDKNCIETVRVKFKNNSGKEWNSLCVSCQVGCPVGCSFCATGKMGFVRNLTVDEITDQVLYFHLRGEEIRTISFMGMGEPLLNQNISPAIEVLTSNNLFNYSQRRISISTVGIALELEKHIMKYPNVNISYSLHSPFEEQRRQLVPLTNAASIKEVLKVLSKYVEKYKRKVFIGYVMIGGVNDTKEHLRKLIEVINDQEHSYIYHVNLIKYNSVSTLLPVTNRQQLLEYKQVHAIVGFRSSSKSRIDFFIRSLRKEKINVTLRQSFGSDIDAACGQLCT